MFGWMLGCFIWPGAFGHFLWTSLADVPMIFFFYLERFKHHTPMLAEKLRFWVNTQFWKRNWQNMFIALIQLLYLLFIYYLFTIYKITFNLIMWTYTTDGVCLVLWKNLSVSSKMVFMSKVWANAFSSIVDMEHCGNCRQNYQICVKRVAPNDHFSI